MNRVPRTEDELKLELREQLALLCHDCEAYDKGFELAGKRIAVSLRVLLHHHKNNRSLLAQLGLRDGFFITQVPPLNPDSSDPECKFFWMFVNQDSARRVPTLGCRPYPQRRLPFVEWWEAPAMRDSCGVTFSRSALVSHVADTDGGAHVDPGLVVEYAQMSRFDDLGCSITRIYKDALGNELNRVNDRVQGRPELACMRRIAWEVIETLGARAPG